MSSACDNARASALFVNKSSTTSERVFAFELSMNRQQERTPLISAQYKKAEKVSFK
jgi:hypothetical protein